MREARWRASQWCWSLFLKGLGVDANQLGWYMILIWGSLVSLAAVGKDAGICSSHFEEGYTLWKISLLWLSGPQAELAVLLLLNCSAAVLKYCCWGVL